MTTDSTVADLDDLHEKAKGARSRFEPDWYLNMAFYQGDQWAFWARDRLDRPQQVANGRVMLVDNRINPTIRKEVAKMTKQRPVFTATPRTGDKADQAAADLSEQMLRHLWDHLKLHRKLRQALNWGRICGKGFWKIYWDPELGEGSEVTLGPDGQPMLDQVGRPVQLPEEYAAQMGATKKQVHPGDVCVEVRSPFEIFPDPLAEELEDCEWLIEETVQSLEYLRKRYPNVEGLEEDADAPGGIAESKSPGFAPAPSGTQYKGVKVKEYWAAPSSKFPNGRYAIWASKRLLREDNNPFDSIPYVMFKGIDAPGRFHPLSVATLLRGPQTELNKTISQISENMSRISNPALLVSRQSNVNYTGVPGERIDFDDTVQNAVPSYLLAPELPGYVRERIDRIEASINAISGQSEVASGAVPTGVTAASAINLLLEQTDTMLDTAVQDMEFSVAQAGNKLLSLVQKFYTDERTVRIAGENGSWEIFEFKGEELRDTKVEVQAGSGMPRSKAAKQAAIQDYMNLFIQNGIALDKAGLAQALKDLDIGGLERMIAQYNTDTSQINREHVQLYQGVPLPINSFDDDELHVAGHEEEQKGLRYSMSPPLVQQAFEQHLMMHRERMQQQQMMMQPQDPNMAPPQGGPNGQQGPQGQPPQG